MKQGKKIGQGAAYLLFVVLVLLGTERWLTNSAARGVAPAFDGVGLTGEPLSLARHRGQAVLVHFWATWCTVCALEHASINALSEDYPVIGVAMDSGDRAQVAAYALEEGLRYPILADESGELAARYGVTAVPMSFIADGAGRVRFVTRGMTTEYGLRARLLLAEWLGR